MATHDVHNRTYDFLAHPPAPKAQLSELRPPTPTVRSISRRRSSTVAAISSWVADVLPGSPPPASPAATSTFPRRPSTIAAPPSTRQHSTCFPLFPDGAPPDTKLRSSDLRGPTYAYTVVPLPIPPSTSIPSPKSSFATRRVCDSDLDEMKLPGPILFRQHKTSTPATGPRSPTPSKKKGLMRFLRPRLRFRSTHTPLPTTPPPSTHVRGAQTLPSSSSPTTVAFRIAHRKRALYAQCGALPLPLDTEIAIMQFVDGGSRADAVGRLGSTFKDAAGVIYSDEEEARECLPLLLAAEDGLDDAILPNGIPSALSGASDGFVFPSAPPSPLFPEGTSPESAPNLPAHGPVASSPLALLSIPARGGAGVPGYLYTTPPSIPLPFGDIHPKTQFMLPAETTASYRKQRRRPTPLALHPPSQTVGFEDSFAPHALVVAPSLVREAETVS